MSNKAILPAIILGLLLIMSNRTIAQVSNIDTIVVNLSDDTSKVKKSEPTPTLNLDALRNKARQDSVRIAKIAIEKEEQKKLEEIREKRLADKLAKEKAQKELAEKKKIEKAKKKKELAEKKKAEKEAKAKLAEIKKRKELEDTLAKQKEKAEKQRKEQLAKEAKKAEKIAEEKEEQEEKSKVLTEIAKKQESSPKSENVITTTAKPKKEMPKPPKGVVQKDNPYGTVRLAYDENAASFLLSIPTETKMHYHANHSEQIMLIEGSGMLLMGYKTIKLKKNELIFITQGTPHKIINNGKSKLKVLSIQAPFYDGTDIIILE